MQTVLKSLHSVPGVVGGLLIDDDGNAIAHSLPSIYDAESIKEISSTVALNIEGLQDFTGGIAFVDMRFENGRVVVKKMPRHILVLLCQQTLNTQLLIISLNVVISKLERLIAEAPKPAPPAPRPQAGAPAPTQAAAPAASALRTNDKGVILTVKILDKTANMAADALISPQTAAAITSFFRGVEYKNLLLQHQKSGKSVKTPFHIVTSDPDGRYNGVIVITPSIAFDLGAKEGDETVVAISLSKGFFG